MNLTSAPPLEAPRYAVGHLGGTTVDASRADRSFGFDLWYPASTAGTVATTYELVPGISFTAAAATEVAPVRGGRHPLIVWSHGRTGMRHNYTLLCEALAARGYIVVSPDHPGDVLFDWIAGRQVDDPTNDRQRIGDVRHCIDICTDAASSPAPWLPGAVDDRAIVVAGHSYGGLTALASAGSLHEFGPDERVRAVAAAQGYTRILPPDFFASIVVPVLMVVGTRDVTTPPSTDADPAWTKIVARNDEVARASQRHDLAEAGHQGCSDFGLYAELAPQVPGLPQIVTDYLGTIAAESPENWRLTWRPNVLAHVQRIGEFLDGLGLGGDSRSVAP